MSRGAVLFVLGQRVATGLAASGDGHAALDQAEEADAVVGLCDAVGTELEHAAPGGTHGRTARGTRRVSGNASL